MIFGILLSMFVAHAADLSTSDRESIEVAVQKYIETFDQVGLPAYQKVVSEEFIEVMGGEHFKNAFLAREKKNGRKMSDLRIEQVPTGVYVQFSIKNAAGKLEESMIGDEWFRPIKDRRGWTFQRKVVDFYP